MSLDARKPVLLDALGLEEAELRDPRKRFDADIISKMCKATVSETRTKNIYQKLSLAMLPNCFSDAGYSAFFESTFGDAIRSTLIAQDLGGNALPYHFATSGDFCNLVWDHTDSTDELIQLVFSNIIQISDVLSSPRFASVNAVYFKHSRPPGFEDIYGSLSSGQVIPCHFDQASNRLEFHAHAVRSQNSEANPLVVHSASERRVAFIDSDEQNLILSKLCYNYLAYLLDKPGLSLDAAAETFSMAERTFRRKLGAEKNSFRHILEQVRRDACRLYFLEGTRSLSDIAAKLGYSELSAFTRAYTAWYGHPPSRDASINNVLAA